jgi:hypothetical protein
MRGEIKRLSFTQNDLVDHATAMERFSIKSSSTVKLDVTIKKEVPPVRHDTGTSPEPISPLKPLGHRIDQLSSPREIVTPFAVFSDHRPSSCSNKPLSTEVYK